MNALRQFRATENLTLAALAARIGVTKATVSRWERGERKIDENLIAVVAAETGIPAATLRPDLAALFQEAGQ